VLDSLRLRAKRERGLRSVTEAHAGAVMESELEKALTVALKAFQRQHDLEDSGELDDATVAKLEQEYGA